MIVALSGFDGSGKTTLAKMLVESLRKNGIDAKYIHGYEFSFLHGFLKKNKGAKLKTLQKKHTSTECKKGLIQLWPWALLIDFSFKILIYKIFYRKKIYVFDRYLYDYFLSCYYQSYLIPLSFFLKVLPFPDKAFLLYPSLKFSSSNRRDEHSQQYFAEMKKLYDRYLTSSLIVYETGLNTPFKDAEILLKRILCKN